MRKDLLSKLAEKGQTFTFEDALVASVLKEESLQSILSRLENIGWIEKRFA